MDAPALIEAIKGRLGAGVLGAHCWRGDATLILRRESLLEAARLLKEDPAFRMDFLMDLTAVDYSAFGRGRSAPFFASSGVPVAPSPLIPDPEPWPDPPAGPPGDAGGGSGAASGGPPARFAVVYHFFSSSLRHRLRLTVPVAEEDPEVDSLTPLWGGADWLEREVWDMFGVRFRGHPGLKRILMYEAFEGHPLRKDYPVDKRQPLIGPAN